MNKQEIEKAIEFLKPYTVSSGFDTEKKGYFKAAISALQQQLTGGWIPITERMPDMKECQANDCRFIVTDGNRRYQDWFDYEDSYFDRCECNGLGLKKDNCVIAWQPMPEPYREEGSK